MLECIKQSENIKGYVKVIIVEKIKGCFFMLAAVLYLQHIILEANRGPLKARTIKGARFLLLLPGASC